MGSAWEHSIQYQRMLEAVRKNPKGRSNIGESEQRGKYLFKSPRIASKGGNVMETKIQKYKAGSDKFEY